MYQPPVDATIVLMRIGGVGWRIWLLGAAAVVLLPWTVYLSVSLPPVAFAQHWALAWTGLDALIALGLGSTAFLAYKGHPQLAVPAVATSTLMVVDAWFDICTSTPGPELTQALVLAFVCELPVAAVCLTTARLNFTRSGSPSLH